MDSLSSRNHAVKLGARRSGKNLHRPKTKAALERHLTDLLSRCQQDIDDIRSGLDLPDATSEMSLGDMQVRVNRTHQRLKLMLRLRQLEREGALFEKDAL